MILINTIFLFACLQETLENWQSECNPLESVEWRWDVYASELKCAMTVMHKQSMTMFHKLKITHLPKRSVHCTQRLAEEALVLVPLTSQMSLKKEGE